MPFITNDTVRIYYETVGEGLPLVLHHGLSDGLQGWYEMGYVARLHRHFRLILIDARGHGASDKPHDPAAYALQTMAEDVVAVLDHLKVDQAHFCGYSMGGWVGFGLAEYAPHRLHSLVLGGTHPFAQDRSAFRQIFSQGIDAWVDLIASMAELPTQTKRRLLANDVDAMRAVVGDDRPDLSAGLARWKMSSLVYAGTQDPLHPLAERAARAMPDARMVSLPDRNHFQAFLGADVVASLIIEHVATKSLATASVHP